MKTANDGVTNRNTLEAERSRDMEQQPNSRRTEYVAMGTKIVSSLVATSLLGPVAGPVMGLLVSKALTTRMNKKGSEESAISAHDKREEAVTNNQ